MPTRSANPQPGSRKRCHDDDRRHRTRQVRQVGLRCDGAVKMAVDEADKRAAVRVGAIQLPIDSQLLGDLALAEAVPSHLGLDEYLLVLE